MFLTEYYNTICRSLTQHAITEQLTRRLAAINEIFVQEYTS